MSANLSEFMKVLLIVVTWSTCILAMRRYMISLDEEDTGTEASINEQEEITPS